MKKIGLFYGTATAKTAAVAKKIKEVKKHKIIMWYSRGIR